MLVRSQARPRADLQPFAAAFKRAAVHPCSVCVLRFIDLLCACEPTVVQRSHYTLPCLPRHPGCVRAHAAPARRYARNACDVSFEQGNAFILPHHERRFDRVHVGGLADPAKLPALARLLKPGGGRLVVPCGPELLGITVAADGKVRACRCCRCCRLGSVATAVGTPGGAELLFGGCLAACHHDTRSAAACGCRAWLSVCS